MDNFKEAMLKCVQDAVAIVAEVKEVPFQTEDIRSIAATLFIGRTKVGLLLQLRQPGGCLIKVTRQTTSKISRTYQDVRRRHLPTSV